MNTQTEPLRRAILTLEGQLVVVTNVILGIGAAIPDHVIPPKWAAIVAGVMNIALIIQRGVLKVKSPTTTGSVESHTVTRRYVPVKVIKPPTNEQEYTDPAPQEV